MRTTRRTAPFGRKKNGQTEEKHTNERKTDGLKENSFLLFFVLRIVPFFAIIGKEEKN